MSAGAMRFQSQAWVLDQDMNGGQETNYGNWFGETMFLINVTVDLAPPSPPITHKFLMEKRLLLDDPRCVYFMLDSIEDLPSAFHGIMVPTIMDCARAADHVVSGECIHMVVRLSCTPTMADEDQEAADEDQEEVAALNESFNSQNLKFVPASESSIQELETVRIDQGAAVDCVICLENIPVGTEATRMPCFHVYHGSCIKDWLKTSNVCALCRYQMPPAY